SQTAWCLIINVRSFCSGRLETVQDTRSDPAANVAIRHRPSDAGYADTAVNPLVVRHR
ncbi:Os01g0694500, partial [Oryza sativa Japonica Group]